MLQDQMPPMGGDEPQTPTPPAGDEGQGDKPEGETPAEGEQA